MRTTCIFLLITLSMAAQSQNKVEREVRVNNNEVPAEARAWMRDAYEGIKKIAWFEEHSEEGRSYEAKLRWKKLRHSVKFDTNGSIIDLEIQVGFDDLPTTVQKSIRHCLDSVFITFNLKKIQIQYTGASGDLEDIIDEGEMDDITVRYEIEFYGKTEDENELWEGLFDDQGKLLKCRIILLSPADNLNF